MNSDLTLIILIIISCITSVLTIKLLKNKIIKKIINIIIYITYILILILILQRIAFRDNRIFNYYIYKIASGSMRDTLQVNDYIIVRKSNNYKVGDIVTYKLDDKTITHRIIEINGAEITTKGDANFKGDKSISKKQIVGKVIFHGSLINFLVEYGSYMIIIFTTTYIVGDIINEKTKA